MGMCGLRGATTRMWIVSRGKCEKGARLQNASHTWCIWLVFELLCNIRLIHWLDWRCRSCEIFLVLHRAFHIWVNLSMAKELCEIDSELSRRKLPSDKDRSLFFFLSLDNLLCGMQLLWPGLEFTISCSTAKCYGLWAAAVGSLCCAQNLCRLMLTSSWMYYIS